MKKFDRFENFYNYGRGGELIRFQVTEKLDGANFRFSLSSAGNLVFGSRNIEGIDGTAEGGDFSKGQGKFNLLKLLLATEKGTHLGMEGVEYVRGKTLDIHLSKPWPWQAEGEIFSSDAKEISIKYLPDSLDLFCLPEKS